MEKQEFRFRLPTYIWQYRKAVMIGVLISLIVSGISLASPLMMKTLVDVAVPRLDVSLLVWCIVGIIGLPLVSTGFSVIHAIFQSNIEAGITVTLRQQLIEKLMRVSPKELNKYEQGDLMDRVSWQCNQISNFINNYVLPYPSEILRMIGTTVIMFFLNWKLTLICLTFIPVISLVSRIRKKRLSKNLQDYIQSYRKIRIYTTELIPGLKTVELFSKEQHEIHTMEGIQEDYRKLEVQFEKNRLLFSKVFFSLQDLLSLGVIYSYGVWLIFHQQLTIGELIAFTVYVPNLFRDVQRSYQVYFEYKDLALYIEKYTEMMNFPEENIDLPDSLPLRQAKGLIEFQEIYFHYQEDRPILQDLNLQIQPGEMIGIVGPTGSGKSTILNLLLRFYPPQSGTILLDGLPIQHYKIQDIRNQIALVSQDIFLWNRSIRNNLLYIAPDLTEEQMLQALEMAQLTSFIESQPDGLETVIGDRGIRLSGGERQRLAIAQALIRQPSILILDEPTSALDAITESRLQNQLEEAYRGKTVIVIAHRLTTVREADRILVIDQGTVIENGNHEELMALEGLYYKMYTEQMKIKPTVEAS